MGECMLLYMAIGQVLRNLWYFEILTLESMENLNVERNRNPKPNRRAKWIIYRRVKRKLWHFEIF